MIHPSAEPTAQSTLRRKSTAGNALLIVSVSASLTAIVFYALTYPLNLGLSDCPNYLRMMAAGSSNLINASGYPAMVHAILSPLNLLPAGDPLVDVAWLRLVQWTQVGIHAGLFLTAIGVTTFLYGRLVASILSLLWGFNLLFLGSLNSASPEWLQADLMLLCLLVCFCARRACRDSTKLVLHLVAALLLAGAYVVKFNSLLLVPALALLVLFDYGSLWRKLSAFCLSALVFGALVLLYANTYHARSTGTKQLSFDHGWVLILALPDDYFQTAPQVLGLNSLKWAVLTTHVPPEYGRSHAYSHISYGSANFPQYRPIWDAVNGMERTELEALVRANPGAPRGRNIDLTAPFYFYYGLEPSDALGIRVYQEALRTHTRYFLNRIIATLAKAAFTSPSDQVVPTRSHPLGLQWGRTEGKLIQLTPPPNSNVYGVGHYNPSGWVRLDGVAFFDRLHPLGSSRWLYVMLTCSALVGVWLGLNRSVWPEMAAALLTLTLVVVASSMLLGLRTKEVATLTPLYFALAAIGLGNFLRLLVSALWQTLRRGRARGHS